MQTTMHSRRGLLKAAAGAALGSLALPALAQPYPSRPIKLVVPFPPGGSVDTVARALQPQLQQQLNQPVVVENRPGASSVLGAEVVKRSPADGYTILLNASLQLVNPLIMSSARYDMEKDFAPISYIGALPQLVVVSASSPYRTVDDLLADARKRPGRVQWATAAYGSAGHLASELLKVRAKVDMPVIPYKGGGPALTDVIGGQVASMVEPMASAYPQVKSGRLRALAVTTPKRLSDLPDLPTVAEGGFPDFNMPSWYGFWAPAGTPQDVIDKLHAEIRSAMQAPEVVTRLSAMFFQPAVTSPAEFAKFIKRESDMYKSLVAAANIRLDE
ncbi:tripartite tricarboxylate transporter substrate binding protein [Variovorax sp. YR216]|uniref:Bug family tripartite tricarboxylate transporter substrate binding protein n=1 Tax=Variovorax sp. YR216 TaxID=1882828 RepID=UPI000896EC01|nr:tripartite tricarboxylate transporter substrate binding protein [Variovorax sp. YR216]SEB07974.1 Tripartite-type tricarboxylate transporter, receptor component TctC [Variovorax sp. YR216]